MEIVAIIILVPYFAYQFWLTWRLGKYLGEIRAKLDELRGIQHMGIYDVDALISEHEGYVMSACMLAGNMITRPTAISITKMSSNTLNKVTGNLGLYAKKK